MSLLGKMFVQESNQETVEVTIKSISKFKPTGSDRDDQHIVVFEAADPTTGDVKRFSAIAFENQLGKIPQIPFGGVKAEVDLREASWTASDGTTQEGANLVAIRYDWSSASNKLNAILATGNAIVLPD